MRLAITLLVKDEVDTIESILTYYLSQNIVVMVVTDHSSTDGTSEILKHFAIRDPRLVVRRETNPAYLQNEWVTEMARFAAKDYAADWVINIDADEFWMARDNGV